MKKTPCWGKRNINVSTNLRKVSHKENLDLFSLDISRVVKYCELNDALRGGISE